MSEDQLEQPERITDKILTKAQDWLNDKVTDDDLLSVLRSIDQSLKEPLAPQQTPNREFHTIQNTLTFGNSATLITGKPESYIEIDYIIVSTTGFGSFHIYPENSNTYPVANRVAIGAYMSVVMPGPIIIGENDNLIFTSLSDTLGWTGTIYITGRYSFVQKQL